MSDETPITGPTVAELRNDVVAFARTVETYPTDHQLATMYALAAAKYGTPPVCEPGQHSRKCVGVREICGRPVDVIECEYCGETICDPAVSYRLPTKAERNVQT